MSKKGKTLFAVLSVACIDNFGFGLVFILFAPLILNPVYGMLPITYSVELRNTMLGILFLAFPLTQFFGAPIIGDLGDRLGRKKAFYYTISGCVIGYLISAWSVANHSYSLLLFSRLWTGFFAGNLSICMAAIADLATQEKQRARYFGFVTIVWGFSWPVAIWVGGYLSDPSLSPFFSPELPFYITAFLSFLSLVLIGKLFKETHPRDKRESLDLIKGIHNVMLSLKVKAMRPFFVVLLVWVVAWGVSVQWYGAYSIERFHVTQEAVSWGLILQGLFWVFGGSVVNLWLLKRFSTKKTALIGLVATTIFLLGAYFGNGFWNFSWLYFVSAIGAAFALSNILSLVSLSAPRGIQGKAMGLSQSMMSLGWFIVPLFGIVMGNLDLSLFYIVAAALMLISLLLLKMQKVK